VNSHGFVKNWVNTSGLVVNFLQGRPELEISGRFVLISPHAQMISAWLILVGDCPFTGSPFCRRPLNSFQAWTRRTYGNQRGIRWDAASP
jgi:hypothetical protein